MYQLTNLMRRERSVEGDIFMIARYGKVSKRYQGRRVPSYALLAVHKCLLHKEEGRAALIKVFALPFCER